MNKSESIVKIAPALVAAQAELKTVNKGAENIFYGSKYADLAEIVESIRPILAKHKLVFMHLPCAETSTMECVIMHESGEYISGMYPVNPVKPDPQALGSAVSYAKRYSLSMMMGVVSGNEDDDGNRASGKDSGHDHGMTTTQVQTSGKNATTVKPDAKTCSFEKASKAIENAKTSHELATILVRLNKTDMLPDEKDSLVKKLTEKDKLISQPMEGK